jgi:hypothetical protein
MSDDTPDEPVELWHNPETKEEVLLVSSSVKDTDFELKGAVPKEDLRALIEEWREAHEALKPNKEGIVYESCAEQLEDLL